MNSAEKKDFVELLNRHFPQATPGDSELIWKQCSVFTLDIFRKAIEQHRLDLGSGVFRPGPEELRRLCKLMIEHVSDIQRTRMKRQEEEKAGEAAQAEQDRIGRELAKFTDAQLAEKKQAVLAHLAETSPWMAKIYKDKDPRKSPLLAAYIVDGFEKVAEVSR